MPWEGEAWNIVASWKLKAREEGQDKTKRDYARHCIVPRDMGQHMSGKVSVHEMPVNRQVNQRHTAWTIHSRERMFTQLLNIKQLNKTLLVPKFVKNFKSGLNVIHGLWGETKFAKQQSVLHQNERISSICTISDIHSGKRVTFEKSQLELGSNDLTYFKYAKITSLGLTKTVSIIKQY